MFNGWWCPTKGRYCVNVTMLGVCGTISPCYFPDYVPSIDNKTYKVCPNCGKELED